jgi:hypothetical protein
MKKSKNYGIIMLIAFIGILALPSFSAPAEPLEHDINPHLTFFENGDEHTSQWLLRSVTEGEEFSNRGENPHEEVLLFDCCVNHHSNISKVRFEQIRENSFHKLSKEQLYLLINRLTI